MDNTYKTSPLLVNLNKAGDLPDIDSFKQDVAHGLSLKDKKLPSRYFYDANGSRLFQQIMHLPEYYPTNCETDILNTYQAAMARQFAAAGPFQLIDLGAGDATKTQILLRQLLQQSTTFEYVPVDISGDALKELTSTLQDTLPTLRTQAVEGEYFTALGQINKRKQERKVVCFLGSNIGNFEPDEQLHFLQQLRHFMQPGDLLLLGIDLCKDPEVILRAYNDAAGVTAAFNLNLLQRINLELGGNFDMDQFKHFALYDPQAAVMKSYLVSKQAQEVHIEAMQQHFRFGAWEAIHTESSYKFTLEKAEALGEQSNFSLQEVYQDRNCYFADVLYTAI